MSDSTDPTSFGGDLSVRACKLIELYLLSSCMLILETICSSLSSTTNEYVTTITLRQGHTLRRGRDIGACLIDYSTRRGTQSW